MDLIIIRLVTNIQTFDIGNVFQHTTFNLIYKYYLCRFQIYSIMHPFLTYKYHFSQFQVNWNDTKVS